MFIIKAPTEDNDLFTGLRLYNIFVSSLDLDKYFMFHLQIQV